MHFPVSATVVRRIFKRCLMSEVLLNDEPIVDQLPSGYRQGLMTAISIITGFTLSFVRYWSFEDKSNWNEVNISISMIMILSLLMQFAAFTRALSPADSILKNYNKTLRIFLSSVVILIFAVFSGAIYSAGLVPFKFVLLDQDVAACLSHKQQRSP